MTEAVKQAKTIARARKVDKARNYQPRGIAADIQHLNNPEIVVSGPAGTGKSRAWLEKLNWLAWEYPRMRGLIVRKTRESLSQSALFTYETFVLGPDNPMVVNGPQRRNRQLYLYPNGSEVYVAGMDKPEKIMSTEWDFIFVQEAIELELEDWESLTTRNRNYVIPDQQVVADTNPGAPTHWLKQRADANQMQMLHSRHEDNPRLWDADRGEWTEQGKRYVFGVLENLTGHRKDRLRFGKWVQAEGVVYENYEPSKHLKYQFEIPADWRRFRVIDFGYTNPFCCQWWAVDPDDRLYLYREIYLTEKIVEDHAARIVELSAGEKYEANIADWDAEDRATLDRHGVSTIPANKNVSAGIQKVQKRMQVAGDGKPRIFFLRDAREEQDEQLAKLMKPTSTIEELDSYIWEKSKDGKPNKETPLKLHDHGMDAMRYMAMYLDDNGEPDDWVIRPSKQDAPTQTDVKSLWGLNKD